MRIAIGECEGIVVDMTQWPKVEMNVSDVRSLTEDKEGVVEQIAETMGKIILSSERRGMKFELYVNFKIPVSEIFESVAPFVVEFAIAMAKPELFAASQKCMTGSRIRFYDPGDEEMVGAVAELIKHVPQGAPVAFEMAA